MCVFPWHAKQAGGGGEKISVHCTDMRVVLEGAHFFPWPNLGREGGAGGVLVELRVAICVIRQTNNQNVTERINKPKRKNKWRDLPCTWRMEERRQTVWSPAPFEGGRAGEGERHPSAADEIHKAMENKYSRSSAAWLLISYLPWRCKNDAASK